LTDDTLEGAQVGPSVGSDIDAVGAMTTRFIPEPCTLGAGLLGAGIALQMRRRRP
jgi:MYXO-CTERM domain-containing protein